MKNDDSKYLINVTHEFKAPISNLKMIIETLYEYNETISSYKRKEILELALIETERLREIVIQFLNIKANINSLVMLTKKIALDEGDYFRVPTDIRGLNYEKYFEAGKESFQSHTSYTSENTNQLSVQQVASLLENLPEFLSLRGQS